MFDRLETLIKKINLDKIKSKKILLVGLGGVGGICLEALVRSGCMNIAIIDYDKFDVTNLNRQIICNIKNIDKNKVDEAIIRAKSINPDININGLNMMVDENNIKNIGKFDYIIDACDDLNAKLALIKFANDTNANIVCALGTGKRLNPVSVKITRLDKTINDPLAKKLRNILRKNNLKLNIPVVYSEDLPINNDKIISSSIFVPSVAGIYLAYYVINDIIK